MAETKIKEISVNIGMSIDQKGIWTKVGASIRLDISDEDSKPENRPKVFERAFAVVEEELNNQLDRLGIGLEEK